MAELYTSSLDSVQCHVLMRDERRKKEASKVKQTTRQSNTAHVNVIVYRLVFSEELKLVRLYNIM